MELQFTKHAREKIRIRQIPAEKIQAVLEESQHRYYDIIRNAEVAAARVLLNGQELTLVVVFARREEIYNIITVYPTKSFDIESERKVKLSRWVSVR